MGDDGGQLSPSASSLSLSEFRCTAGLEPATFVLPSWCSKAYRLSSFLRMAKVGIDPRTPRLCWIIVSLSWCCILITELRPKIERLLALSVIDD